MYEKHDKNTAERSCSREVHVPWDPPKVYIACVVVPRRPMQPTVKLFEMKRGLSVVSCRACLFSFPTVSPFVSAGVIMFFEIQHLVERKKLLGVFLSLSLSATPQLSS